MSYWCCAMVEPFRENLAQRSLSVAGYESYIPRIAAGRRIVPLFPSYCFILIEAQWWQARWALGISFIISTNNNSQPTRVPDGVIEGLRKRERGGLIVLPQKPRFRRGDRVRVTRDSPFAGSLGIFAGMRPHERCEILLARLASATLPLAHVEALVDAPQR